MTFPTSIPRSRSRRLAPKQRMDLGMSTGVAAWGAMVVDHNDGMGAEVHCLTVSDVGVLHFVSRREE